MEKEYDVNVKLIYVKNEDDFTENWNSMGENYDNIDMVIVNVHGNPEYMDCVNMEKLDSKKINTLILLSCNVGHQDYQNNMAYQFFKNNDVFQVVAPDGTHWRTPKGIFNKHIQLEARDDDIWDDYRKEAGADSRKGMGFVRYSKFEGDKPTSIGKTFNSIVDLINATKNTPYKVNNDLII